MTSAPDPCRAVPRAGLFGRFAAWTSRAAGGKWAFLIALGVVVVWAITGPLFRFSEGWQLIINTGTTIVTFLMVFLIQNAQNRDAKAIQIKLDELIHSVRAANNAIINIEDLTEEQLDALHERYQEIAQRYHATLEGDLLSKVGAVAADVGRVGARIDQVAAKVGAGGDPGS